MGTPYHSPKLHPRSCSSVGEGQTDWQTHRWLWPLYISHHLQLMQCYKHSACSESVGGPSGAAWGRQQQFRRAHDDCRKSLRHRRRSAGGRSDRSATSRRPQNAAQCHVSPSAAHRSAFWTVSHIIVTTSGELILLPVGDRHPKLNVGRRPLTRYSDFDIPPLSSRTYPAFLTFRVQNGAKTTSGSGFDPKFGCLAPSFLLESGFVTVYCQILSDFTLRAVRYARCR